MATSDISNTWGHLPSGTSQTCTTLPSTLTLYPIFGNLPQLFSFQNQTETITMAQTTDPYHFYHSLKKMLQKTLEKTPNTRKNTITILTENILIIFYQHGFKHKHSTRTASHNICHQITKGFNN